jgi:hypothetical protein
MYYQNRQSFEPSAAARTAWYKTRKQTTSYGATRLPGLFGTHSLSTDTIWVIMAVVIEVVAVVITIWLGLAKGFGSAIGASIAVGLFVVLDYAGILFHSHLSGERAVWRNELLIVQTPQRRAQLEDDLNKRTLKEDMGVVFLFLSALLKITSIAVLGGSLFSSKLMIVLMCIFYLMVIYIHAYHTGLWLAEFTFKRKIDFDYAQWSAQKGNDAQIYIHKFRTPYGLQLKVGDVKNVNCQTLTCQSFSNGLYSFELKSVGLMWDEDIATICMGLLHEERPVLALECLQLQLTQTVAIGNSNVTSNVTTSSSSAGITNSNGN